MNKSQESFARYQQELEAEYAIKESIPLTGDIGLGIACLMLILVPIVTIILY
jgi:hypothetical protein